MLRACWLIVLSRGSRYREDRKSNGETAMSTTIQLPAISVSAAAPGYAPIRGLPSPAPNPGETFNAYMLQRFPHYAEGRWREMLIKLTDEQSRYMKDGKITSLTESIRRDLTMLPLADNFLCKNPHLSPGQALFQMARNYDPRRDKLSEARELSGSVLTPVAALSHFLNGDGAEVRTNINNLGLKLSSSTHMPELEKLFASAPYGSSPLRIDKMAYKTGNDSWGTGLWLGSISLKIEGIVHKGKDNLKFVGNAKAYHDLYDANKGTHRDALSEKATSVLAAIEEYLKGTPYPIAIQGELPINIER